MSEDHERCISDDRFIERQLLRLPAVLFGVIRPPRDAKGCGTGEITTNLVNQESSEVDSSHIYSGIHKAKNCIIIIMAIFSSVVQLVSVISSRVTLSILSLQYKEEVLSL